MPQAEMKIIVRPGSVKSLSVCLFVSYSPRGRVKNYVRLHLDRLRACGISVFFIMVADRPTLLNLRERIGPAVGLVVRQNLGFDFGAWADVLRAFPALWEADALLLVNDSIFGPFGPYPDIFRRILTNKADLIGLTESTELQRHYQSYFLTFRGAALRSSALREFWEGVENLPTKRNVIDHYEIKLLDRCVSSGLSAEAIFPSVSGGYVPTRNPTQAGWLDLINLGYPYIKIELLKENPHNAIFFVDWRNVIHDEEVIQVIDDYIIREK
jgi:hypothetical protein